jgi:hypothetical protein
MDELPKSTTTFNSSDPVIIVTGKLLGLLEQAGKRGKEVKIVTACNVSHTQCFFFSFFDKWY